MKVSSVVPVIMVAALAACGSGSTGSGSSGGSPASTSAGGAAAPSAVSARPASASMDAGDLAAKMHAATVAKRSATIALTSDDGLKGSGVVDYGTPMKMSMTIEVSGARLKAVVQDATMYLNVGTKVKGKDWFVISADGTDKMSTSAKPIMSMILQQSDPGATAASYRGVTATASPGPVLDGVSTTAYTFKLTTRQLAAAIPSPLRSAAAGSLDGTTALETITVGPDWLPAQVKVDTTTKTQTISTTATYSHWGEPVTVTVPPASDVATGLG